MATAQEYASWIVKNKHLKGTEQFETVSKAYQAARDIEQENIAQTKQYEKQTESEKKKAITQEEPSLAEKAVAGAKAGASLTSQVTTGGLGALGGTLAGLAENVATGQYGTPEGARLVEQRQQEGAQALSYTPQDELAQKYTRKGAEILGALGALPMTAELHAITELASPALTQVKTMAPQMAEAVSAPIKAVAKPMQPVTEAITATAKKATEKVAGAPKEAEPLAKVTDLAQKASAGDKKATVQLAEEAKVNPEALKAAEDLGIDLPIDVFSESNQLKAVTGLSRAQLGSGEQAAWLDAVQSASNKADEALQKLSGGKSVAEVSQDVGESLSTARNDLKTQSKALYDEVDQSIPKNTPIDAVNIRGTIQQIVDEIGDVSQLSKEERELKNVLDTGTITYGGLLRLKSKVGDAIGGKATFGDVDSAALKRLYGAIKEDQLHNIRQVAGDEMATKLHFANRLTQRQKALEDRIKGTFGVEGEGSIAPLMTRALKSGASGDVAPLNKLLKTIPEDMHSQAIASAVSQIVGGTEKTPFSFAKYETLYRGLMKNRPVYEKVVGAVGKDKQKFLNDLYQVSKSIKESEGHISKTGASSQKILETISEEKLGAKAVSFFANTIVKKLTNGTLSLDKIVNTPKDKLNAIGETIRSEEFKNLAKETVKKEQPSKETVKQFVASKPFKALAREIAKAGDKEILKNPTFWVLQSLNVNTQNKDKKF